MGLDILAFVVPIILILVVVVIFLSFVPLDFGNFRRRKSQHLFFGRHAAASRTG